MDNHFEGRRVIVIIILLLLSIKGSIEYERLPETKNIHLEKFDPNLKITNNYLEITIPPKNYKLKVYYRYDANNNNITFYNHPNFTDVYRVHHYNSFNFAIFVKKFQSMIVVHNHGSMATKIMINETAISKAHAQQETGGRTCDLSVRPTNRFISVFGTSISSFVYTLIGASTEVSNM